MAKMEIPLNGSNFVSELRQNAFKNALSDDHKINCEEEPRVNIREKDTLTGDPMEKPTQINPGSEGDRVLHPGGSARGSVNFDQALDHTYKHQQRMMEIHQQYLAQQAEYIQLITTVLDQQGKALNVKDERSAAGMIETFQRTLDNFHTIREQGLKVHREFLIHQATFSEKYLSALEQGHYTSKSSPPPAYSNPDQESQVTEWVVKQPHIILDDHWKENKTQPVEESSTADNTVKKSSTTDGAGDPSTDELAKGLLEIVGEKTGYPVEMLELDMDLEADLGIDSIKRVEIMGSLEEKFPSLPPADTEILSQTRTLQEIIDYMETEVGKSDTSPRAVEQNSIAPDHQDLTTSTESTGHDLGEAGLEVSVSELSEILLDIVAEYTGYPPDMLDQDMDMEADLGIDSIKRVEILGAMEDRVPGLPSVEAEELAELRTLGQIVELMSSSKIPTATGEKKQEESKKKGKPLSVKNTAVKLVSLPEPDYLDFMIPQDRPIIITSDGTDLTSKLQADLSEQGWKTIIWEFPMDTRIGQLDTFPTETPIYQQSSLGIDDINHTVEQIRIDHGNPSGFIHLHPQGEQNGLFSDRDEKVNKEVFFLAAALHDDLNQTDPTSRNFFLSITRTNGSLGFDNSDLFQEGMGLSGLVKSLAWEWPEVFCRFIDFSSTMNESEICGLILKEIHDPNQVIHEIGLSENKRVSIEREPESDL